MNIFAEFHFVNGTPQKYAKYVNFKAQV